MVDETADKSILPEELETFARLQGLRQAILVGWGHDNRTYVVTWGDSIVDSLQAGRGGNVVKTALGFPEAACRDMSPRVRRALAFYAQAGQPWEPTLETQDTPAVGVCTRCGGSKQEPELYAPFSKRMGIFVPCKACSQAHEPEGAAAGPALEGESAGPAARKSVPVDARSETLSQALLLEAEAARSGDDDADQS